MASGVLVTLGERIFSATTRFIRLCSALSTMPIPPAPQQSGTSYAAYIQHYGGFDQECAAVVVARMAVSLMERSDNSRFESVRRWLDRMLVLFCRVFGSYAVGNPDFQIRFRQMFRTTINHHAGWNVDDVVVRDPGLPDFGSCGGCAGAPAFTGLVSVVDEDPCADSGVTQVPSAVGSSLQVPGGTVGSE